MAAASPLTRQDLKLVVVDIQRQLKAKGAKISDANRHLLDASETLQRFQYLRPGVGSLPGAETSLLELKGTVQMQFNGNGYYVPLAVYLRNDHPGSPPVCIIQPTMEMMIRPNHHHVDIQGLVYLPYLHEWGTNSTVVGMLAVLEEVFAREPFIFKKPTLPTDPPAHQSSGKQTAKDQSPAAKQPRPIPNIYKLTEKQSEEDEAAFVAAKSYVMTLSGRALMDELKQKANEMDELDAVLEPSFRCPISMEIMSEPVFAADGHTYEKLEMERWLQTHDTSPLTNEKLPHKNLIPNNNLRSQIVDFQELGGFIS